MISFIVLGYNYIVWLFTGSYALEHIDLFLSGLILLIGLLELIFEGSIIFLVYEFLVKIGVIKNE